MGKGIREEEPWNSAGGVPSVMQGLEAARAWCPGSQGGGGRQCREQRLERGQMAWGRRTGLDLGLCPSMGEGLGRSRDLVRPGLLAAHEGVAGSEVKAGQPPRVGQDKDPKEGGSGGSLRPGWSSDPRSRAILGRGQ